MDWKYCILSMVVVFGAVVQPFLSSIDAIERNLR